MRNIMPAEEVGHVENIKIRNEENKNKRVELNHTNTLSWKQIA